MTRPVERKVYAGSLGALSGSIVSDFALWGIDQIWWPSPDVSIPAPVASFASAAVITIFTFLAGWLAKHDPGYAEIEPLPDV
jgi:hypothetical protein